jgi:hypothetical protein
MAWKRAMVRAARAMGTATRVAGDKEDAGVKEGNDDEEGNGDGNVWVAGDEEGKGDGDEGERRQ